MQKDSQMDVIQLWNVIIVKSECSVKEWNSVLLLKASWSKKKSMEMWRFLQIKILKNEEGLRSQPLCFLSFKQWRTVLAHWRWRYITIDICLCWELPKGNVGSFRVLGLNFCYQRVVWYSRCDWQRTCVLWCKK